MAFKEWLQAIGKLDYVQGKARPNVDCILCAVRDNDERVISLKIFQDDTLFVSLNLYPYNPGHLMVVPNKHIERFVELEKRELIHIFRTIQGIQLMLEELYSPKGYNIGINEGNVAGASIKHLHVHVVPRYKGELGYIDIVGQTRVVPEGLESVKNRLEKNISKYLNKDFFEKF
ncbi:MAG: HIT family protein [Promethearchaeota archaeon]